MSGPITITIELNRPDTRTLGPGASAAYIRPGFGDIVAGDGDDQQRIGIFRATIILGEAMLEDAGDPLGLLRANSRMLAWLYATLFDTNSNEPRETVQRALQNKHPKTRNVLFIERIALIPAFRGRGVGPHVLRYLVQRMGDGIGTCALDSLPLQMFPQGARSERELDGLALDQFATGRANAVKSLAAHFTRQGFAALPGSSFMVRSMADTFAVGSEQIILKDRSNPRLL